MKLPEIDLGRAIAYVGQLGGLALSLWANIRDALIPEIPAGVDGGDWHRGYTYVDSQGVTHAYEAIKPGLYDLVSSAFFPVALFLAIELLMRVRWQSNLFHWGVRIIGVGGFAATTGFISYWHLRTGFLLADWDGFTASVAPLAIDGFMGLCALVLYMTGPRNAPPEPKSTPSQPASQAPTSVAQPSQVITGPPAQNPWATPPSHLAGPPWATPSLNGRAAPEPPAIEAPEPPVSHPEIAGQTPSHSGEPPNTEPPARTGSEASVVGGPAPVEPPARERPEPPKPPSRTPSEPLAQEPSEPPTDPSLAEAVRLVDEGKLSQRKAADTFSVSRSAIQRELNRRAAAPAAAQEPTDEVDREVEHLDDAIERILTGGDPPEQPGR